MRLFCSALLWGKTHIVRPKRILKKENNMIALLLRILLIGALLIYNVAAFAESRYMGVRLCHTSGYTCYQVKRGDTWGNLFSDSREQDIVMRVNRMGIRLHPGMILAIPKNLEYGSVNDYAPFPKDISAPGENIILVSLHNQAWAAYNSSGSLVRWGPASSAVGYCPDEGRSCHTVTGHFAIYLKEGQGCVSRKFPIGRGGAPMPYCMYFHGGFALHGSYEVPGYNASHGCVRIYPSDAEWLNEDFTTLGTPVIVNQN
jgi:L,D-transpeptidase ErfK/SrfK